jgi:3,5-epimerase/4-reductase
MLSRILIFGKGFIGQRLAPELDAQVSERMIYNFADVQEEIDRVKPDVIINCIGYTGKNNVDDCELEQDKTLMLNTYIPILLAEVAIRNKIKLVHLSSGCIYNYDYTKDPPIVEERNPDFFDLFYSRSKIYAERALDSLAGRSNILIARIRIPLDSRPHPKNLLTKLINYKKVIDIPNSLAYLPDFIQALKHLIAIDARGIYNVVNSGGLRYSELMEVYKRHVPDFKYELTNPQALHIVRTNLVLSTEKLKNSGFKVRDIHEVLEECVTDFLKYQP